MINTITKQINMHFKNFTTIKELTDEQYDREEIRTIGINVYLDSNNKSKQKFLKDIRAFAAGAYQAFQKFETDYVYDNVKYCVNVENIEEYSKLTRLGNTPFFYSVEEQDLWKIDLSDTNAETEEDIRKELDNLDDKKIEELKNGKFFINIFLFVKV